MYACGILHILFTLINTNSRPMKILSRPTSGRQHVPLFFRITQYNADTHNARTLIPMNMRTQTLPLWAPLKDWAGRPRDSRSHHRRLAVDGVVAYHWKHSTVKSWIKSRKMRAPVPSRELKPRWTGFTTRNPTSWCMISSQHVPSPVASVISLQEVHLSWKGESDFC
jgi:hypothetical protein